MLLINQHTKNIMEECKKRALDAGLEGCGGETLEYIVSNRDLLELMPKMMIPTLYDFWSQSVEELASKEVYKIFPHNPYETVINTWPAVSFYNDNNPDWLNVMIFYHVLAHIDFFRKNSFYSQTWLDDFLGKAKADKKIMENIRKGKNKSRFMVDIAIEFARAIDNLVGFHKEFEYETKNRLSLKISFYLNVFLPDRVEKRNLQTELDKEIKRYNEMKNEDLFFKEVSEKYVEFQEVFKEYEKARKNNPPSGSLDIMQYIMRHSDFLQRKRNRWMKEIISIIRDTSLYFQPQIRTKIMNEGWASYWHQELFRRDDRIRGHEVDFSKVDSGVTQLSRMGLNPYAVGLNLFAFIKEMADKGRFSLAYQRAGIEERKIFDDGSRRGLEKIFQIREQCDDSMFINLLSDDDFQDFMNRHRLAVFDAFIDTERRTQKIYIKSKKAKDYREMLLRQLYHPPKIMVEEATSKASADGLYLNHQYEGRMLVTKYIPAALKALAYFWDDPVHLETTEFRVSEEEAKKMATIPGYEPEFDKQRVKYTQNHRNRNDGKFTKTERIVLGNV